MPVLLAVLAVSIICGVVVQKQALLVGQGAGIVLVLGLLLPRFMMWGMSARASFTVRRATEGEFVELRLMLRHCYWWVVRGLWLSLANDVKQVRGIAAIPVGAESRQDLLVSFTKRGRIDSSDVRLWTNYPFGLLRAARPVPVESPIVIWPRPASIPFDLDVGIFESALGTTTRFGAGSLGDFSGLRSFREGDRLRRVHWAQTARRDELIVCEMQSATFPEATICLDLNPLVHVGRGSDSSLEWAIRIAAGLIKKVLNHGGRVSLAFGNQCLHSHDRHDGYSNLMDALALAKPNHDHSLERLIDNVMGNSTGIIITTDVALNRCHRTFDRRLKLIVIRTAGFDSSVDLQAWTLPAQPCASMIAPGVWEATDDE